MAVFGPVAGTGAMSTGRAGAKSEASVNPLAQPAFRKYALEPACVPEPWSRRASSMDVSVGVTVRKSGAAFVFSAPKLAEIRLRYCDIEINGTQVGLLPEPTVPYEEEQLAGRSPAEVWSICSALYSAGEAATPNVTPNAFMGKPLSSDCAVGQVLKIGVPPLTEFQVPFCKGSLKLLVSNRVDSTSVRPNVTEFEPDVDNVPSDVAVAPQTYVKVNVDPRKVGVSVPYVVPVEVLIVDTGFALADDCAAARSPDRTDVRPFQEPPEESYVMSRPLVNLAADTGVQVTRQIEPLGVTVLAVGADVALS